MEDRETRLLREYVRQILAEDDYGGMGAWGGDMSGYMQGWGFQAYGGDLGAMFVQPFLDVGKVFKAETMKLATRVKTLLKVTIEATLTTVIPFLQSNFALIFKQEKAELQKIRQRYQQVYDTIDKAFGNKDVMILAFMLEPSAFITAKALSKSPEAFMSALEVFAQGSENLTAYFEDIRKRLSEIDKHLKDDIANYKLDAKGNYVPSYSRGPYMTKAKRALVQKAGLTQGAVHDGIFLFEDMPPAAPAQQPQQQNVDPKVKASQEKAKILQGVMQDPNVIQMMQQSKVAQELQAEGRRVTQDISQKILQEAQKVLTVRTPEDLQRMVKGSIGLEKLASLNPQEKQKAEQALMGQTKAAMKSFYVKMIQQQIDGLTNEGLNANSIYITTLKNTLSKINSMK